MLFSILENFGYRQMLTAFKIKAFYDFLRRRRGWGRMKRQSFGPEISRMEARVR
jgi:hypothetical protein